MIYLVGGPKAFAVPEDFCGRIGTVIHFNWREKPRHTGDAPADIVTLVYEPSLYRKAGYSAVYRFRRRL